MMKKGILATIVIIGLILIGGGYYLISQRSNTAANQNAVKKTTSRSMVKRARSTDAQRANLLILYYSNSGTTKAAAQTIQKQTGATLVEMKIDPAYPSDYDRLVTVAKNQIDKQIQPKITNLPDLSHYDTILLGFPTWYHRPPMFIKTFFATADLKNKTVIPFTTSMSSSIKVSTPYLKAMAKGTGVKLQTGFRANNTKTIINYLKAHQLTD